MFWQHILDFQFHHFSSINLVIKFIFDFEYFAVPSFAELVLFTELDFVGLPPLRYLFNAKLLWSDWNLSVLRLGLVFNNFPDFNFSNSEALWLLFSQQAFTLIIFFYAKDAAICPGLAVVFFVEGLNSLKLFVSKANSFLEAGYGSLFLSTNRETLEMC